MVATVQINRIRVHKFERENDQHDLHTALPAVYPVSVEQVLVSRARKSVELENAEKVFELSVEIPHHSDLRGVRNLGLNHVGERFKHGDGLCYNANHCRRVEQNSRLEIVHHGCDKIKGNVLEA